MVRAGAARSRLTGVTDWRLLIEPPRPVREQMARDAQLGEEAQPAVRWFTWDPPAVSLGLKQEVPAWLRAPAWRRGGLDWVRRPSGGGIAFHGSDVSLAVVVPRAMSLPLDALMRAVCESAVHVCRSVGVTARPVLQTPGAGRITYCLAERSPYAVMAGSKKVAGFALRRMASGWLIEGSMLVKPLPERLAAGVPGSVLDELRARAVPLAEAAPSPATEQAVMSRWAGSWAEWWEQSLIASLAERG